jgi:hypothetical protein
VVSSKPARPGRPRAIAEPKLDAPHEKPSPHDRKARTPRPHRPQSNRSR